LHFYMNPTPSVIIRSGIIRAASVVIALAVVTQTIGARPPAETGPGMGGAGAWSLVDPLAYGRSRHAATLLDDGRVLVTGGRVDVISSGADLFRPGDGTWAATRGMLEVRSEHAAVKLADGRVLVIGGAGFSGFHDSTEIWDPTTGLWTEAAPLRQARGRLTATALLDGRVLVVGGYDSLPERLASAEVYDPRTGRWSDAATMHEPRSRHTATLLADGRVLVAGGAASRDPATAAEVYDPTTDRWTLTEPALVHRDLHAAVRLGDGTVLVCGGLNANTSSISWTEIYDPTRNQWEIVSSMLRRRALMGAVRLANGHVLVVGGAGSGLLERYTICEAFDPSTRTWTEAASMSEAHIEHTVTLLSDGRVFVAGGSPSTYEGGVAEVYSPEQSGPRIDSVEFRAGAGSFTEIVVRGAGFAQGATLYHIRDAFADPPRVSIDGTELVQAGHLADGSLIDHAFQPKDIEGLAVLNPDATVAGIVVRRPERPLAISSVEVVKVAGTTRLIVRGTNIAGGATVRVPGTGFVKPTRVVDGTTLVQRGKSEDGRSIGKIVPRGASVAVSISNPDGERVDVVCTRP
jgi:hypothetical protein